MDQNRSQEHDTNRTMNQSMDREMNQTREQNQTHLQLNSSNGISATVHEIIDERKNGTIEVPQGVLVRVEAQNRVMNFGNITAIALNETLRLNVKNKSIGFAAYGNHLNISDGNSSAETSEAVEVENETVSIAGKPISIMPSQISQAIRARAVTSQRLELMDGKPVYQVNATRTVRFLGLFETAMDLRATVDASNGQVISESRPWWSFLVSAD